MLIGLPYGLRDIMPAEAQERRTIERRVTKVFKTWGYGEIITPAFEYYDSISRETGELIKREMLKLFDSDGSILALRPEMTTPIARLVAQRMKGFPLPLRFYYLQNVFREEEPQRGQQREFYQAGIELIGWNGPEADAETIMVLIEALLATGLKDFKIAINQIEFVKAYLKNFDLNDNELYSAIQLMADMDFVALKEYLKSLNVPDSAVGDIARLKGVGAIADAKKFDLNEDALAALANLEKVYRYLEQNDYQKYVLIDFSVVRNFEYYTGIIFEGFSPGLGFPFCGGGRYNKLLGEFDYDQPATGFQIGIERLQIILAEKGIKTDVRRVRRILVGCQSDMSQVFKTAKLLRQEKMNVTILDKPSDLQSMTKLANERSYDWLIIADSAPVKYIELASGREFAERPDLNA